MWLLDQLAEQHIREAQSRGDLDHLPGAGKPLILDDDSQVPEELRVSYRLLKNAGYLPPELEMKKEAIELDTLLQSLDPEDHNYQPSLKRLRLLEIKLTQAGICTRFLKGEYRQRVQQRFAGES